MEAGVSVQVRIVDLAVGRFYTSVSEQFVASSQYMWLERIALIAL